MSGSDNNTAPSKGGNNGRTDRELLGYLFGLVEFSKIKLDIENAPRPAGRTIRGCELKIQGLKSSQRAELDTLRSNDPSDTATAKSMPKKGGRKRKADEDGNAEGAPKKRGRATKKNIEVESDAELSGGETDFKSGVKNEEREDDGID